MSFVIVPEQLTAKLEAADTPLQMCTKDGRVIGYFTPTKPAKLNLDPGVSEEELDRREARGGGRPLADILRDLDTRA
jgi:hypothetical protein